MGEKVGVFRVHPAAICTIAQQHACESGLQLALQATVRKMVKFREGMHG